MLQISSPNPQQVRIPRNTNRHSYWATPPDFLRQAKQRKCPTTSTKTQQQQRQHGVHQIHRTQ